MDFSFQTVLVCIRELSEHASIALDGRHPGRTRLFQFSSASVAVLTLGLVSSPASFAAGDPNKGAAQWEYLCDHCHGTPQPHDVAAFKAYGKTANPLSVYASNLAAITKAITVGYTIPQGNTNDDYPPGTNTARAMESFVGMGEKRMGVGETPTQYAIDISAYLASYFDEPGVPTIGSVTAGNAQATVSFSAPKSDLPITSYMVTANPGGITATGNASPVVVTGLSTGVAYTFTVQATSNAGTSKPSSASNAVTLTAPQQAVAVRSAPAVITPSVPAPEVKPTAAPVVSSQASATKASTAVVAPTAAVTAAPAIAGPLKPAAPVATANTKAVPAPSVANKVATTQAATVSNPPTNSSIPAPTIMAAKPGSSEAKVFFTVPQDALTLISSYTVVAYSGGKSTGIHATGPGSPIKITGLTNGTEYVFYVFSNAKTGARVPSAASNPVTPLGILGD